MHQPAAQFNASQQETAELRTSHVALQAVVKEVKANQSATDRGVAALVSRMSVLEKTRSKVSALCPTPGTLTPIVGRAEREG